MNTYLWSYLPFGVVVQVRASSLEEAIDKGVEYLINNPEESFPIGEENRQQALKRQLSCSPFKLIKELIVGY